MRLLRKAQQAGHKAFFQKEKKMKLSPLIAAFLLFNPFTAVQANDWSELAPHDVFADSAQFDGSQQLVAKRGRPLAQIELSMPLAVQLDGEVSVDVQSMIAGGPNSPLSSSAVLWSSASNKNIYCGVLWSRRGGKAGPCLVDTDHDGKFDAAIKGGARAVKPDGLGFSNNLLLGIWFDAPIPLAAPVAYHQVSYANGPRTKANMTWALVYKTGKTGPATIYVQFETGNNWQGTGMLSESTEITFTGSPVAVDINGVRLTIHDISPKRELIYSLEGSYSATPMKVKFLDRVTGTMIFI